MAFKTFINGNNLPASDLNTYLMQQSVITFANAAARTSAITTPVEGMTTYLADVDRYEFWNGSAWKRITGDAYSSLADRTTNAYPVDGQLSYLTATSATDTANQIDFYNGSAWESIYTPGRNAVINGGFDIWQRGASNAYGAGVQGFGPDRFATQYGTGTTTLGQQSFTLGSAPVAGYEGRYFLRVENTANSPYVYHKIESVRTFAGETATFSFFAKVATAGTLNVKVQQFFGTGGSTTVVATNTNVSVTTGWARYSITIAVPSIAGKTISASNNDAILIEFQGASTASLDLWGLQFENGSVATPFRRAGGTLQGELAACQRYYYRSPSTAGPVYAQHCIGLGQGSTTFTAHVQFPVPMRTVPNLVGASALGIWSSDVGPVGVSAPNINTTWSTNLVGHFDFTASGLTNGKFYYLINANNANGYLEVGAEL